jgi:hypothetical protein
VLTDLAVHRKDEDKDDDKDNTTQKTKDKDNEIVILYEKKVHYVKLESQTIDEKDKKVEHNFKVTKKIDLNIDALEKDLQKPFEDNGYMVTILDEKIYYNLRKDSGGSIIFDKKGELILRMKANIYPAVNHKKKVFIFDKMQNKLDLLSYDKFNELNNRIQTDKILCLSNICVEKKEGHR